ncbi:DUF1566 domain-containing protein [Leptospira sp. 201903070]|uniref:DUF1566 domain-containing protein n=1 Tax=Leptospira ainlahdjerensis TaxID=2810033 RepID=A0ABS2U907_9LEPT|nr:DUF1566 domain-containing protein [Leptospira ainlahdjerensis]MBM9576865.1 DUF1566 domain-containing protein [Leptospira ainlahdjerensis]
MDDPKGGMLLFSLLRDKDNTTVTDSSSSPPEVTVATASVHSIVIDPSTTPNEYVGGTIQFRAYHYINGVMDSDVTEAVDWTSSNAGVLTVSNTPGTKGLATKSAIGSSDVEIQPPATLIALLPSTYTIPKATATIAAVPDTTQPTITSFTPSNGSSGFQPLLTFAIDLYFDEAMDTSLTPALTIEDRIATSTFVPMTGFNHTHTWVSNTHLTIRLSPLPDNFSFRWTLSSTSLKDLAGNSLNANYTATNGTVAELSDYPLSDTGQTGCWDTAGNPVTCAGTGMDASILGQAPSATFTGPNLNVGYPNDPITFHGLTNKTWASCVHGQVWNGTNCTGTGGASTYGALTATWSQAIQRCRDYNNLNSGAGYAGKKGWRLPTIKEFQSLFDYSYFGDDYLINPAFFPNTIDGNTNYWSSTVRASSSNKDKAFKVNIYAGKTQNVDKGTTMYHYCVTNE